MSESMSGTFNIGISARMLHADGTPAIKELDFSPLLDNPSIVVTMLPDVDTGELLYEDVKNLDAAILFLENISEKTFAAENRLTVLARYGVGFDTLDIPACTNANVAVAIAPSGVRRPVATTVIALLLALTLNMKSKDMITRDVPQGWSEKMNHNGVGLVGRTLGCVGMGNIGAEVFRLIAPFDMELIAHDPYCDPDLAKSLGVRLVSLDDLFIHSDVVSLNCPLAEDTFHLVNAEKLALMKPTAYLINTARGPVVNEKDLIDALQKGVIAGAGLDVFEEEPPQTDNPLLTMSNVILAPHALCFTDQCMGGLGEADVKACLSIMHGKMPETLVNPEVVNNSVFSEKVAAYRQSFRQG